MRSLRVAVEGCGHGTLHAIYASVAKASKAREWGNVDLLIIGGDFQAIRNASDLTVMACPVKYRKIGDFHSYYSGARKAPYLTIFVGGNHEASSHLWELFYGGWVAPNIYYMGAANILRVGGVRIAGMSGIWKGYNFRKSHYERLPYNQDDIRSIYHVREIETRKLLQIRTQVDVGISHDWPKSIETYGNTKKLFKNKPDFQKESRDGTFGNVAAKLVMDRLRPPYWFSAHMHCKHAAIKVYDESSSKISNDDTLSSSSTTQSMKQDVFRNKDEIDLGLEQIENNEASIGALEFKKDTGLKLDQTGNDCNKLVRTNYDATSMEFESQCSKNNEETKSSIPLNVCAQLPATFPRLNSNPLLPSTEITNKTVRFLSLDKCLPGRKFLQLLTIDPQNTLASSNPLKDQRLKFEYDPEWLAITRAFDSAMIFGDRNAQTPPDLGEAHYLPLIQKELEWVNEHVVKAGKLEIPENFQITATPYQPGKPEIVKEGPLEYNNPQTQQFCELIGITNKLFATEEERADRLRKGPAPVNEINRGDLKRDNSKNRKSNFNRNSRNFRGSRGRKC
ncbi:Lariat debranching enzyme [Erysiphe neolycopersici]|uniref:Lariat debranching enzyme n=1 Tax=Erysiphe neolycopersici TaxID=212602 RepID=A0A420HR74_9PEZI|nr:Lariat debranching enzyme [Erysiphe neolycopersici]